MEGLHLWVLDGTKDGREEDSCKEVVVVYCGCFLLVHHDKGDKCGGSFQHVVSNF